MLVRQTRASSRGYTLIEMIVVISVLALVSVMVAPSLVSMKATSDHRSLVDAIHRLAPDARERAIRDGRPTQIAYDDSTKQLQIQEVQDDGTANTLLTVQTLSGIEPVTFQLEGKEAAPADFKLSFTPDGHSNGGGIEFKDFSIYVDKKGSYQFLNGPLPLPEDQRWQAGDLEQRG